MVDYHIKRLGHRGDGVTEEGYFAPLTLPQERISAEAEGKSLSNVKILQPSEHRVKPPCPHFKSCGGCALQHASDGFVANWKVDVVREALAAHGIETELRPCLTSPTQSRRRASFSARRTKKDALAGFHARGSDVVIDIEHCVLIRPELRAALGLVKALAITGASRKGEIKDRAEHLLEFVGLYSKRNLISGDLSFGQQKLLEFAMALMNEPKALLLDEPTAGINPTLINGLIDRLRRSAVRPDTVAFEGDHAAEGKHTKPDGLSQEDERNEKLLQRIADLPELQRVVIERAYLKGYTLREVSEQLEAPLGTVKSALSRGLLRLRERAQADTAI